MSTAKKRCFEVLCDVHSKILVKVIARTENGASRAAEDFLKTGSYDNGISFEQVGTLSVELLNDDEQKRYADEPYGIVDEY